jgi:hypothetical protein
MTITTARRRLTLTAVLAAGIVTWPAPAAAEPAPPTPEPSPLPPAPMEFIPPPVGIGNPLAQNGTQPAGPFGLPDLSANAGNLLLGQNAAPSAPGASPAAVPNLSAFNPDYLLQQNLAPAAPGEGTPAPGIGPDGDNPGTGRIAFLQRLHEMYEAGSLTGALLGQAPAPVPGEQVGVLPAAAAPASSAPAPAR